MSELAQPGTCLFCGQPAPYTCDYKDVLQTWQCEANRRGDPDHAEHNYRWTQSCYASMCEAHTIEMDDNFHLCVTHRPCPPEEAIRVVHKLKVIKPRKKPA